MLYHTLGLGFLPHKSLINLTLPHTFQLCAWLPRASEWAHCKVSGYHQSLYQRKMAADFKWVNCFFKTRVLGQCCFISRQLSLFIVSFYRTAQPLEYYRQFLVRSSCKLQPILKSDFGTWESTILSNFNVLILQKQDVRPDGRALLEFRKTILNVGKTHSNQRSIFLLGRALCLKNLSIILLSATLKTSALCLKSCSKSSIMLDWYLFDAFSMPAEKNSP